MDSSGSIARARSPKQFPVARRSFGATAEKNETISDEFSRDEIVEAETQDDADHQVAGPSIIPDSKSKFLSAKRLGPLRYRCAPRWR